jgi:hypothetical protein
MAFHPGTLDLPTQEGKDGPRNRKLTVTVLG